MTLTSARTSPIGSLDFAACDKLAGNGRTKSDPLAIPWRLDGTIARSASSPTAQAPPGMVHRNHS
jgi:hypothetical protein